ncbi:MAG TPA: Ig-like domain-containing protein, partial [Acidimicrobiales bacterium]|nr:Ig-like domain-containing protein [Acidimicrobiales bacterium]
AATISNATGSQGLATGVSTGVVTITATDPTTLIPGTAVLTVLPAVLLSITVAPTVASVPAGQTQQFTATGYYSDLSTQNLTDSVTWSTSGAAATISNATGSQGLATGVSTGVVTITATDPTTLIPGTAVLTVTPGPAAPSITMTPSSGRKRAHVTISGTGFTPGQSVTITYFSGRKKGTKASTVVCTTSVASDGTFACNGRIPRRHRAGRNGQKTIEATEPDGKTATTTYTLT